MGKVLKIVGIGLLICISVLSWVQAGSTHLKSKSLITCDCDSTDTIIFAYERFRGRISFDVLKKMTLIVSAIQNSCIECQSFISFGLKSLLTNSYQRNVFYVYSFSTVP